ncbi:carboxylesterase family protein-like protein [Flagelloscypha sp. PMI_526]|nr:carboxylesterase family protein-like protein [Flagelloscypha sp. PMI_526]
MLLRQFFVSSIVGGSLASTLPIVDLGYDLYQAANLTTQNYYTFSNIRYAAPPVGDLRWRAPQEPSVNRSSVIQTAPENKIVCPQAASAWYNNATAFLQSYLGPLAPPFDPGPLLLDPSQPTPPQNPYASEDCLVLDVFAPKQIFNNRKARAPVLVWIHGGGYTFGSKDAFSFTPEGLYNVSQTGFVTVAINYRLGALGFLAGSVVKEQGVVNAGLLDQRFALEWVRTHISKFGGDPSKVTIMGESAGAGSVVHQITAYGGARGVPFAQAVPQSAVWLPNVTPAAQDTTTQAFLGYLKATSLDDARKASYEDIIRANLLLIGNALPYPSFPTVPVPDGSFVPGPPAELFESGKYTHGIRVLTGHNLDEGLLFTNPVAQDDASFIGWMHDLFPSATDDALAELLLQYPSNFNGSLPYTSQITRAALALGDLAFNALAVAVSSAKKHEASFAYFFTAYPALHGQDSSYVFYTPDGPTAAAVPNATVARAFQKGLASFIMTGTPDFNSSPLPPYGSKGNVKVISNSTIESGLDPALNARTAWWNRGGLLGRSGQGS